MQFRWNVGHCKELTAKRLSYFCFFLIILNLNRPRPKDNPNFDFVSVLGKGKQRFFCRK